MIVAEEVFDVFENAKNIFEVQKWFLIVFFLKKKKEKRKNEKLIFMMIKYEQQHII